MINSLFKKLFSTGLSRSTKIKNEIIYSFLIKGVSIVIGFIYVPLLIDYLDSERYGIWLTLSSFIGWFNFFDFGLGNGFRNKLTEAIARNDIEKAKEYTSTTYFFVSGIFLLISILLLVILHFINWERLLNIQPIYLQDVKTTLIILSVYLSLRFILKLIGIIYIASQKPSINNLMVPLANVISFIIILFVSKIGEGSLIKLGLITSLSLILVYLFFTIYAFSGKFSNIKPSLKCVRIKDSKDLMNMGFKFFIIQILGTLIYMTSNFLISHFIGPNEVTIYNIAYKYLSLPLMVVGIIVMPFWSAFTDAYTKKEYNWMRKNMKRLLVMIFVILVLITIMVVFSPIVYNIWIKNRIQVPFLITVLVGIFIATHIIEQPFNNFLNGVGKIKISIILVIIKFLLFFPLVYISQKMNFGISGIISAGILINIISLVVNPIQVYKILSLKADGIWDK